MDFPDDNVVVLVVVVFDQASFNTGQKTGGRTSVLLIGVAMQIINKYVILDALKDNDHVLPILSNQKMNAYLKELADLCGITKNLSFHVARHTFATTITLTNGVPLKV